MLIYVMWGLISVDSQSKPFVCHHFYLLECKYLTAESRTSCGCYHEKTDWWNCGFSTEGGLWWNSEVDRGQRFTPALGHDFSWQQINGGGGEGVDPKKTRN